MCAIWRCLRATVRQPHLAKCIRVEVGKPEFQQLLFNERKAKGLKTNLVMKSFNFIVLLFLRPLSDYQDIFVNVDSIRSRVVPHKQ